MELHDDHSVCRDRLRHIVEDIVSLRAENSRLRSSNAKLLRLLAISPRAVNVNNYGPPSSTEYRSHCASERRPLPKSVSVKSRMVNGHSVGPKARSRLQEQRSELELYDQGAFKTELCNKWESTGTCPYGGRCRFAHGVAELHPILQDNRDKTDVCSVVRDGRTCPYGHRCHFRHSLTRQEMIALLLPR